MRKITICISLAFIGILEVSAQSRQIIMPKESQEKSFANLAEQNHGYWCSIDAEFGSTLMENKKNVASAGLNFTNGYRFSEYLKVGVGLGILYYINNDNVRARENHLAMPLFFNLRGNLVTEEIRHTVPYWSINVGAVMPDGFFFNPQIGLRIGEKRSAFCIGIGYVLRKLDSQSMNISSYSGASLKVGYEF